VLPIRAEGGCGCGQICRGVEGHHPSPRHLELLLPALQAEATGSHKLVIPWFAAQLDYQPLALLAQLMGQLLLSPRLADRRRQIPQVMEDRTTDVGPGKHGEGHLLLTAEALGGSDQAK
jgi:hypothetical protein